MSGKEDFGIVETGVWGKVKFYDSTKNWGFVTRDDGKGDVFLHGNEVSRCELDGVSEGEPLIFDVDKGKKGFRAKNVARP